MVFGLKRPSMLEQNLSFARPSPKKPSAPLFPVIGGREGVKMSSQLHYLSYFASSALYWKWSQSWQAAYWPRAPSTVLVGGRPHHRYRRVRSLLPVADRALQKTNKLKNKPFSSYVTLWICFLTHLVPLKNSNFHKSKFFGKNVPIFQKGWKNRCILVHSPLWWAGCTS